MTAAIRATKPEDLEALAQFLTRIYKFGSSDHHAGLDLLEWKYLRPQPQGEGNRSYLLEKNGQIMAHCGICPVTFHLPNATTVKSVTMTDWAADPSAPGTGIRLFRHLMEMAPTSFVIGGAPPTRRIVPRLGFRLMGNAATYSAWLRPWREFRTRPLTARSTLRLVHGLTHPARSLKPPFLNRIRAEWGLVQVSQFDDSLLPLLNRAKQEWTFCRRTLASLNHLMQCPRPKMQGFLLRRNGDLVGYFVIGQADWEARLLDLVVDSPDAKDWELVCGLVTEAARLSPAVCRIRALAAFPILRQALQSSGYWHQYEEPIMLHDPSHVLDPAFPVSFHFVDGDSGY
jgi:GNAT acetyltransferase-like protein